MYSHFLAEKWKLNLLLFGHVFALIYATIFFSFFFSMRFLIGILYGNIKFSLDEFRNLYSLYELSVVITGLLFIPATVLQIYKLSKNKEIHIKLCYFNIILLSVFSILIFSDILALGYYDWLGNLLLALYWGPIFLLIPGLPSFISLQFIKKAKEDKRRIEDMKQEVLDKIEEVIKK